jgi:hypothetical protein
MITNDYLGIVNKVDKLIININNCNSEKLEGKKCSDFIKVNNVIVGKFLGKYYFKSVND